MVKLCNLNTNETLYFHELYNQLYDTKIKCNKKKSVQYFKVKLDSIGDKMLKQKND